MGADDYKTPGDKTHSSKQAHEGICHKFGRKLFNTMYPA